MKRHDGKATAGLEQPLGCAKAAHELGELVVDRDAQRLEGPRRGMGQFATPRRRDARDEAGELEGGSERLCLAVGDDGARDSAGGALLAEVEQNVRDRRFVLVA